MVSPAALMALQAKYSVGDRVLVQDPSKPRSFLRAEVIECLSVSSVWLIEDGALSLVLQEGNGIRYRVKVSAADLLMSITSKEKSGFSFEVEESKIVTAIKGRQSWPST
jgi:hypothetical protein